MNDMNTTELDNAPDDDMAPLSEMASELISALRKIKILDAMERIDQDKGGLGQILGQMAVKGELTRIFHHMKSNKMRYVVMTDIKDGVVADSGLIMAMANLIGEIDEKSQMERPESEIEGALKLMQGTMKEHKIVAFARLMGVYESAIIGDWYCEPSEEIFGGLMSREQAMEALDKFTNAENIKVHIHTVAKLI